MSTETGSTSEIAGSGGRIGRPRMSTSMLARTARLGLLASLFFAVLGCRWGVEFKFGSDLPNWDQWDAEALQMYVPWTQHHFTWATPLVPQNEHRIVLTRLLNLGLIIVNGQWDQRLEAVVNALLPAGIAVGWMLLASRFLSRRWLCSMALLLAVAYGSPLSWQNVIAGFHSQQFFLIALSLAAIVGLVSATPGSRRWWMGAGAAVLALGSMATGFFAAPLAACILLLRRLRRDPECPAMGPTLLLAAGIGVLGWLAQAPQPGHDVLHAHTAHDFLLSVWRSLEWPVVNRNPPYAGATWIVLPLWLPWIWMTERMLRRPASGPRGQAGWVMIALGVWVLLQVLATAYARGAGAEPPAPRYVDTLVVGSIVNALAVAWLVSGLRAAPRLAATAAGIAWIGCFGAGVHGELQRNFSLELPAFHGFYRAAEQSVRNYLATGDPAYLKPGSIPYPSAPVLVERLNLPGVRSILPASVRPPLSLGTPAESEGFFEVKAAASPTDRGPPGLAPLDNRRTWESDGSKSQTRWWISGPISARPGWLAIETAGDVGEDGVSLELRAANDRKVLENIRPSRIPGDSWRTAYVRVPNVPFVIAAEVDSPTKWVAFSEPVEMAPLSHLALDLAKQGTLLAEIAAGAGLASCLVLLLTGGSPLPSNRSEAGFNPGSNPG